MRLALITAVTSMLLGGCLHAGPPGATFPQEIRPAGQYAMYTPKGDDIHQVLYLGLSGVEPIPPLALRDPSMFLLDCRGMKQGRYRFVAVVSSSTGDLQRADFDLVVGTPGPEPGPTPDPNPPGPDPEPNPDDDDLGPAPISLPGLRVLILYETGEPLPIGQQVIIYSEDVREYLNKVCVVGPDGKTREWRFLDKDLAGEAGAPWAEASKRKRDGVPWLIVSDGKKGYEGPLPKDVSGFLEVLKKFER